MSKNGSYANQRRESIMLFNPVSADFDVLDPRSREIMPKTIEFFESKGQARFRQ